MNIIILGGGSAGWLAAAYLSQTNKVEIKLPKNSKPIGVGESTLPGLVKFFDYCGISEDDVINKCDAVIKYGIKHHGWHKTDWIHPFPNNMHAYHLDALKMIILLEEITRPRLCKVDNPSSFGIADIKDGKIIKITEKPKEPISNLAVTGIYLLDPVIFEIIDNLKPSWRNELEITDALDNLLKQNNNISYEKITDYWKDTGTPQDILHANGEIISKHPDFVRRHGSNKVIIGKNCKIGTDVKIEEPVIIGNNCEIIANSSIGPNVSVGDNSIISVTRLENSIIMDNCKVNSIVKIKNSIIASKSEIKGNSLSDDKIFLLGEGSKISL